MSYDHTTKCLVCPRYHDAAPCTHYECSHYCSDECKVVDMPVHKTLCKSFAQFKALSGLHKRRAIYLPVDGSHPEFVWLEMDEQTDYTHPNFPAMHRDFLGGSKDQIYIRIRQDMLSMASTLSDHPEIILVYGSIPPYTDQPLNKSVSALLGKQVHDVRGPVIAYGLLEKAFKDGHYVTDLDTTDLGVIANWFLGIHREAKVTMLAVRVNSDREQRLSGRRFEPRSSECILPYASGECGTMSQISVIFGMPLMIMMGAEGPNLGRTPQMLDRIKEIRSQLPPDSGNRTVTLLLIYMGNHILTADKDFGTIPEHYSSEQLGPAIVWRKDMKPLDPNYLEAFCDWIEDYLLPKFTDTNEWIKHALANEADDEDRFEKIDDIKQNMWDCCMRKEFYKWCKEKKIRLSGL